MFPVLLLCGLSSVDCKLWACMTFVVFALVDVSQLGDLQLRRFYGGDGFSSCKLPLSS
jgi:hypothetical protein